MTSLLLSLAFAVGADPGIRPLGADGKPLNLDFETGTLKDWTAEGDAFQGQPVEGDTVFARRPDMRSLHQGRYWIGTFERLGDKPIGTLTSVPFKVTHPWATFLVAGGQGPESRVELVDAATKTVFSKTHGDESETLKPVAVDLTQYMGKSIFIRLVDNGRDGWGHINFDNFLFHAEKPNVPQRVAAVPDDYKYAGQDPEVAARNMTVPPGFRVSLFAGEPDLHQPIAFCFDDRGRLWVVEAYVYPRRNPEKGPIIRDRKLGDKILIFEDTDGDGKFDKKTVFMEGLNMVSGIEYGYGGIWVGAAPYFMYIPIDASGDRPAGEPQILLDGWGYEDTHETLNSFIWGPDGWLYGCHGVFTHSRVGKPGTPARDRTPINAGIWRYHPKKHVFEVFAHGISNPWGIDFNEHGDLFAEACVIPHLWHVVQGARYERQAGQHFNPYTYVEIPTIAKHRHYVGANPHGGNGRSDSAGGGHAHSGLICYQGGLWPKEYHGKLFMGNIHGHRINVDTISQKGSGYEGDRNPDFLLSNDKHFILVALHTGPDGNVFFCDWSDKQVCHRNETEIWDRTNGRLFKIIYKDTKNVVDLNLQKLSDDELVKLLKHENNWYVRHASRILRERGKDDLVPVPETLAAKGTDTPRDRRMLASKLTQLPAAARVDQIGSLLAHGEDAADPLLPYLDWFALEPIVGAMPQKGLQIAKDAKLPTMLPLAARRVGALGTPEALSLLVNQLASAEKPEQKLAYLRGLQEGLKGRKAEMPAEWSATYAALAKSDHAEVRSLALSVAVAFRDPGAIQTMFDIAANPQSKAGDRVTALNAVLDAGHNRTAGLLKQLISEPSMRSVAIRSMARVQDGGIPESILSVYSSLSPTEKRDAVNTLASRSAYARALLAAVEKKQLPATDIPAETVRQLRNLNDKDVVAKIADVWGTVRDTPADRKRLISEWTRKINAPYQGPMDLAHGRAVFAKVCQQCHTLYGVGGKVGPEITGSNRADLAYLLENIFDPSAVIPKEYAATKIDLADGRVVTGIIKQDNGTTLTVATATETLTIPSKDVEKRTPSELSMMPDDLIKPLNELEFRNLVAYLRYNQQVPIKATVENAKEFFNGKDLTGWDADPVATELKVWSVENGEIVGRSEKGLKRNTFLTSNLEVSDFKLTLKIKLTPNKENSGVQIRSVRIEGGEMRGPQCDAGKGWWGKLYEESGRGLLVKDDREKLVKENDWNEYRIEAKGNSIKTWLNGQPCVNLTDEKISRKGLIGLQVHSGGPIEVRFKDLKLEVIQP
ncbi:MAG: PVC-type heme-binding CxxCH protein [Gemmataceae bacterium]